MLETKQRTIKLECPLVSEKTVDMCVWEYERIDLGCIARAFGLDPQSVKLNRHFIARGLDHVASSVTWKSLLSYFSSKRLSATIVVDGKLSRAGSKRGIDSGGGLTNTELIKKKIKDGHSGENGFKLNGGHGCKRKQLLDGLSLLKRLRINETSKDITAKNHNGVTKNTLLRCSPNGGIKRKRETEIEDKIMAVSYKKLI